MISISKVKSFILVYLHWSLEDTTTGIPKEAINKLSSYMKEQLDLKIPATIDQNDLLPIIVNIVNEFDLANPGMIARSNLLSSLKYIGAMLMPTIVDLDTKIERIWNK